MVDVIVTPAPSNDTVIVEPIVLENEVIVALPGKGEKGDPGEPGADGVDGEGGIDGTNGAAGAQGVQGATGPTGAQGIQGPEGAAGTTGATGAAGPKGDPGNDNLKVQTTNPALAIPGMWVDTSGGNINIWIETGI